ncbi:hypothetical protein BpHYR1_008193 [Brachionus plicatilis]|uniref:Uncharacterized protein n=1 Tax=Brachionus plicatilis TaxID=10195 RepID=A0A3M7SSK2_BRAPC|nr:hypothetical protein BpHYR1_008193 [Brachionus plicatilis]
MSLSILVDNGEALISFSCTFLNNGSDLTQRLYKIHKKVKAIKKKSPSPDQFIFFFINVWNAAMVLDHQIISFDDEFFRIKVKKSFSSTKRKKDATKYFAELVSIKAMLHSD